MSRSFFKQFFIGLACSCFAMTAKAQSGFCPSNLDFELGDFTGWECRAGLINNVPLPITGPLPNRHTIITAANAGTDYFGGFPTLCPNGSNTSMMLGNHSTGSQSESISYTYSIPSTLSVFSMLFYYAVVLENPTNGHTSATQPRFMAKITDLNTNLPLPCVDFDFVSGSVVGFRTSPFTGNQGHEVKYKDWTPVSINLNAYIGRTIKLEFITRDCNQSGHAGYAYIDVSTACNGAISGANICGGDDEVNMTAPFGYESYRWFSDLSYSSVISTSQTLSLSPAPTVGSIFPVEVTPFPGFGCIDTLFATISITPKPISEAGADVAVCKGQTAIIGGPPTVGHTYEWTPSIQVSNPIASTTTAWNLPPNPQKFYLKTTDILTGCYSIDSVIVSNVTVDTAIRLSGQASFCDYGPPGATLTANASPATLQWYDDLTPIPGATGSTYQPSISGSYWVQVSQNGCTDSSARINVAVNPVPDALFDPTNSTLCITGGNIVFTNQSTISNSTALSYNWKFSDGTTMQTTDADKTFAGPGTYDIELVVTSIDGCKDSTSTQINVVPNGVPDFKWDSICVDRPIVFENLSNEAGASSATYLWSFGNGDPDAAVKDPPPVTYTTGGEFDVTLQITTAGCEASPQSITKKIRVNTAVPGVTYRSITVPEGSSAFIHARPGIGNIYLWKPSVQLSAYDKQYTEFFAIGSDQKYLIEITNQFTCVTTDTIQMNVLKKPGHYLATAFTPNGDGLNDVLQPYLVGMKGLRNFAVFNRWGNMVFRTTTYGETWNGKFKGEDQPAGVYVWNLEYYDQNNKIVVVKGTVTIIR